MDGQPTEKSQSRTKVNKKSNNNYNTNNERHGFNLFLLFFRVRSPSPEIVNEVHSDNLLHNENGQLRDVYHLPPPLPSEEAFPRNRIPSPVPPETKEKLNLDYVGPLCRYFS